MRSTSFTVRFPYPVREGAVRRQEHAPFETLGKYLTNLVRLDLIIQCDHGFTKWFADQSNADQDFIDDCLDDFPGGLPETEPTVTRMFCQKMVDVQMKRRKCTASEALKFLPHTLRALCAAHGFV